jgi:hypothetical protein
VRFLRAEIAARYRESPRERYDAASYRRGATFSAFVKDYPALLSTCHSLRESLSDGYLLDYLIIDEASQVNLLLAGLAMSCARPRATTCASTAGEAARTSARSTSSPRK